MPFVLDVALKASALLLLAAAAALIARRTAAAQRHLVWMLTLTGLVVLPLLAALAPWRLPVVPVPGPRDAARTGITRAVAWAPASGAVPASVEEAVAPAPDASAPLAPAAPTDAALAWTLERAIAVLWVAGLVLLSLRLVADLVVLRRIVRSSRPVVDVGWGRALASATARLGVGADVRLLESPDATMPMAFGLRRPVIVLPAGAEDWSAELRDVVLLHELAHVRRGDVLAHLVGQVACALYWFHPFVWGAARRLRAEAERACDDLVLGAGAPASNYAAHLLAMVQGVTMPRAPAFAVPMAQRSEFEGRVLAILEPGLARHGVTRRAAFVGAVALVAVALPLAVLGPAQAAEARPDPLIHQAPDRPAPPEPAVFVATDPGADGTDLVGEAQPLTTSPVEIQESDREVAAAARVSAGLVAALDDAVVEVRVAAVQALGERQDTAAINALVTALRRDASREVRRMAAWALGEIESARAVPGLLAALREERDPEVRLAIVRALGEIESEDAVDGLGGALRGETEAEMRRGIIWALGEIESAEGVRHLVPALRDADAETRRMTVWALGEIESAAAVEPLAALLVQERSAEVREQAVWALGEIEDRRALPALEAALRDSSHAVRSKAVWALGEIDGIETAPAGLVAALRDDDAEVRRMAAHALAEIADPASVPALAAALRDPDLEVRRSAIQALGEIRGAAAVEALVAAMRDEDPEIRRLAAQALGNR